MNTKIGVIGCGTIGEVLVKSACRLFEVGVIDVEVSRSERFARDYGVFAYDDHELLITDSDIIIVCVKPHDFVSLQSMLAGCLDDKGIISIIPGQSVQFLRQLTGSRSIALCMPNIAARVGKSLTGVVISASDSRFRERCVSILGGLGKIIEIPESKMDGFTALSGSGIAFALMFIHAMAASGVKVGFDYQSSPPCLY